MKIERSPWRSHILILTVMNRTLERRTAHGTFGFCTHVCTLLLASIAVVCACCRCRMQRSTRRAIYMSHMPMVTRSRSTPGPGRAPRGAPRPGAGGVRGDGCAVGCHGHGQPLEAMIASRATPSDPIFWPHRRFGDRPPRELKGLSPLHLHTPSPHPLYTSRLYRARLYHPTT